MTHKTLNAWGASSLRGCLLSLLIAAIVVPLGGVCVLLPLYVVQTGDFDNTTTFLIVVIPMIGFVLLMLGGSIGFGAWMLLSRKRQLDGAFTPLGLTGGMYLLNGRQYHGTVSARQVDAYFYRGPTLDLYLSTPLKTRLGIGTKDSVGQFVLGLARRHPMPMADPDLSHLNVFPLDEAWSRALLNDLTARAAILRLTADEGPYELRQVILQPESLLFRLYRTRQSRITPENVRQWFDDLLGVARAAESLAPPQQTAAASGLERTTRTNRNALLLPALRSNSQAMAQFIETWKQRAREFKIEVYAIYLAYKDPRVPLYARIFAACVVGYAFSPIDLIPDPIPILGYLDDLVLIPLGVALAIKMIPPIVLAECRDKAREVMQQGKPVNRIAAAIIITIWLLLAILAIVFVRWFIRE